MGQFKYDANAWLIYAALDEAHEIALDLRCEGELFLSQIGVPSQCS